MATFRIETLPDAESGMVYAELFHEPGDEPVVRSQPMYHSHEEAEGEIRRLLRDAWPDSAPFAVDPSIGV